MRAALPGLLFALAIVAAPVAADEAVTIRGNVSWVSGGVGEESREHLAALAPGFNLRLVLALRSGDYLGDVVVAIADADGREVLQAVSEGPIFMARLPPGRYEVTAMTAGVAQRRKVVVGERQAVLHFRWNAPAE